MRSGYDYDRNKASEETGLTCPPGESQTQQQFKEETDINEIVRRFGITGQVPEHASVPQYGDFTEVTDYQTALNAVIKAQNDFMELPAQLRARFQNNPQALLEFLEDSNNQDEAIKLGLVQPKVSPEQSKPGAPSPATPEP